MHSSRMRTARFHGHLGLNECLPLVMGVYTPPGHTAPLGRHPRADTPWVDTPCQVHAGIHTPCPLFAGIHTPHVNRMTDRQV